MPLIRLLGKDGEEQFVEADPRETSAGDVEPIEHDGLVYRYDTSEETIVRGGQVIRTFRYVSD
jgi:hypothetical protein